MENKIDWASIEAQISEEIEHLRGDKEFIAFVKSQIKRRIVDTRFVNRAVKTWISERDRGIEHTGLSPNEATEKYKYDTGSGFMRHIFLVYGWLRYKALEEIEPNAKAAKVDYWRIPLEGWKSVYSSNWSPTAEGMVKTAEWLHAEYMKWFNQECEARQAS